MQRPCRHPLHTKRVFSPQALHASPAPTSMRLSQGRPLRASQAAPLATCASAKFCSSWLVTLVLCFASAAATGVATSGATVGRQARGACFPTSLRAGRLALFIGGDSPATGRVQEGRTSRRVSQTVIPAQDARPITTAALSVSVVDALPSARLASEGRGAVALLSASVLRSSDAATPIRWLSCGCRPLTCLASWRPALK